MTSGPILHMDTSAEVERVGGKAAALMRLSAEGFNVPKFLVVEPGAFSAKGLSKEARQSLLQDLPKLGTGPYAARSSAVEEDGAGHSHAGQFLSVLNLKAERVPATCTRVWKSGLADNVATYRSSTGLNGAGDAPAVIVQQMVDARCAGVAFTADPVSGRQDRIVVSATQGLGDRLVGCEEDGQTYVIDKQTGSVLDGPDDGVLSDEDLKQLAALAVAVEKACDGPQDIEWAFDEAQLYLLQSRPITTPLRPQPIVDRELTVFDNSNIIESYPGLVSPLTYSFAQYAYSRVYRAFVRLVGVNEREIASNSAVFDNMLARIDGRVYYNLINWYRALALLPGFSINRAHMETMMGVGEPLPEEVAAGIGPAPATGFGLVREWLKVGGVAAKLAFEALRLDKTVRQFYQRLNNALAEPAATLDEMPLTQLAAEYRRIEADLLDRWDAPLVNDFLCMMSFGGSRKLLEKWAGQPGLEVHNDIMVGQGDIVSAEPAQRIRHMGRLLEGNEELREQLAAGDGGKLSEHAEMNKAIQDYLDRFADRCTEELKLESVTLDRDPGPLYRAVAAASLQQAHGTGAAQPQVDLGALFKGRPVRRAIARTVVGWAKKRVRDRENLRFERTRIFGRARHLFRSAGRQFYAQGIIEAPDHIFYLTVPEVLGFIEGFTVSPNLAELAAMRKQEMEQSRQRPDPDERLTVEGAALAGTAAFVSKKPAEQDNTALKTATGCAPGCVTATARVIRDPRTESLEHGDILVARHTDPGWIAVFSNASAIVVERGSLLSHSAIVARELGIPCVVGLKGAMDWIQDGETIEVDGAAGTVKRLI